jgi:hypothetical protein
MTLDRTDEQAAAFLSLLNRAIEAAVAAHQDAEASWQDAHESLRLAPCGERERAEGFLLASRDEWGADQRLQWMLGINLTQAAHVCIWDVNSLESGAPGDLGNRVAMGGG